MEERRHQNDNGSSSSEAVNIPNYRAAKCVRNHQEVQDHLWEKRSPGPEVHQVLRCDHRRWPRDGIQKIAKTVKGAGRVMYYGSKEAKRATVFCGATALAVALALGPAFAQTGHGFDGPQYDGHGADMGHGPGHVAIDVPVEDTWAVYERDCGAAVANPAEFASGHPRVTEAMETIVRSPDDGAAHFLRWPSMPIFRAIMMSGVGDTLYILCEVSGGDHTFEPEPVLAARDHDRQRD